MKIDYNRMRFDASRAVGSDPDPLAAARAERAAQTETSADKRALKAALAELERAEQALGALGSLAAQPVPPREPMHLGTDRRRVAAVAVLSDVHYGARFAANDSTTGNAYSPKLAAFRLQRFFAATEWHVRQLSPQYAVEELILACLGDNVEGQLHEETVETAMPSLQALQELRPLMIQGVRGLRALDLPTTVIGAWGNHGRDTIKIRYVTGAHHSVDWLLYQDMASELAHDGVRVVATPAIDQYYETVGHTIHAQHGTGIRYLGGIGGPTISLNKAVKSWDLRRATDVHLVGHLHTLLYGRRWFMNGSLKGYDPYASGKNLEPEEPAQWFFLIDSKRGPTHLEPMWVGDHEQERILEPELFGGAT
jgi:hypothetical protein